MLGGVGAGTSARFWVRFVMAEGVAVWAVEFMHSLTGFADLYRFRHPTPWDTRRIKLHRLHS
jgi:hypothetical protein